MNIVNISYTDFNIYIQLILVIQTYYIYIHMYIYSLIQDPKGYTCFTHKLRHNKPKTSDTEVPCLSI